MFKKVLWSALVIACVCWPFVLPGTLAARDMLVLDHPGLTPPNFGAGDLPPRNVPQDGVLAILGIFLPASWFARALMIGSAVAAAWGAIKMGGGYLAIAIAVANPFVVERLLQGHWSLVAAAWLMVALAASARGFLPIFFASLTPTGSLAALAFSLTKGKLPTLLALLCTLPWVLPALIHSGNSLSLPASASTFAPRAEEFAGTFGALLGLGGIWNSAAVPPSRSAGFAVFGIVLFVLLLPGFRQRRDLTLLAALGLGGATLIWLFPDATGYLISHVPGAGLIRDGQKLLILAIPAYVSAACHLNPKAALAGLACFILQTPDAPTSLKAIAPTTVEVDQRLVARLDGRDTFFVGRGPLTKLPDGRVIVDPYSKAASKVESGALSVDGVLVDAPSARWVAAQEAWENGDVEKLAELGVGAVVTEDFNVVETSAPARSVPWFLHGLWFVLGLVCASAYLFAPTRTGRQSAGRSRRVSQAKQ